MLDDLQRDVGLLELALVSQCLHRVIRSAERVHERDRQRHVQPRARGEHLTEDDVEEAHLPSLVAAHRQQRLRALQAHRGSQAAVELEECGLGERVHCLVMIDGLVHVMEAPYAAQRSTASSRIHALSFSLAHTWYACLNCEMAISLMPCSRIFCADCSNTSSTVIFSVRFRSSANIPIVYSRGASFANHPADVSITGVSGVGRLAAALQWYAQMELG